MTKRIGRSSGKRPANGSRNVVDEAVGVAIFAFESDCSLISSAMGEITRRWPFEDESYAPFELVIKEPPLTGDNLGLKTWGSSYVLAQMLHNIGETSLSHLVGQGEETRPTVLELGSGTGLLGLAAAAIWKTHVILSDLPEIVPNLGYNVEKNRQMIEERGGAAVAGALTWGGEEDEVDTLLFSRKNNFKVCICRF